MIVCRSSMLSRFINGILRRRPGMLGLDHLTGGTLSSGHRPLVHFQLATGGTFWVATEAGALAAKRSREGAPRPRSSRVRACAIVRQPRRTLYYRRKPKLHDAVLIERTKALAQERQRFGWRRLIIMVRRDLVGVGESRFRRIYRDLGLQVHLRKKRKVRYVRGNTIAAVARPDERWSIDFMHDRLATGRTIRTKNVVDDYTRECLAIDVAFSFGSHDVIRSFEAIADDRTFPQAIRFDNGPEFESGYAAMGRDQVDRFAVYSAWQANPKRTSRVAQRPRPRRAAQRPHVSRYPGCSSAGRLLEAGLQRDPPAFFARLPNPEGVRRVFSIIPPSQL